MIQLIDSPFSPFARKVRLVLEFKQLAFESVDALCKSQHETLSKYSGRKEVPALIDGDIVVANSADIVSYLEHQYPDNRVFPSDPKTRVLARAWERSADTFLDPVLVNISYWGWTLRTDKMPDGLLDTAREDLELFYQRLDQTLTNNKFVCGQLSIADIALFPHLSSVNALNVAFDPKEFPALQRWFQQLRNMPLFRDDLRRTAAYLSDIKTLDVERQKIFWRGDRIEWMLSRGFHRWFNNEIESDNVLWPGVDLPPVS